MGEFRMPSLGADMDEGTVTEWMVQPGDAVHRGDIVAVVDTDKADVDVEIFENGVIEQILVPAGERVAVGTPLAMVRSAAPAGTAPPPVPEPPAPPAPGPPPVPEAPPAPVPTAAATAVTTPSPVLRRLARHLGVDLETVAGTGPDGAITRADVESAARAAPAPREVVTGAAAPSKTPDRDRAMREAIARLMARSKREIPHYYLGADVDFSRSRAWLDEANAERPVAERLLPAVLELKAVALAAREFPDLNGFWVEDGFVPGDGSHLGVAISLRGGGLIAPALHDADAKTLDELMRDLRDLVARTRAGRLRSSEMSDATITVTNLGDQGVRTVFGVIYPPQVALVGFGKIDERPWAEQGMVGARPAVSVTLAADHRASDGARGARFLARIDQLLQDPASL
jgi:pyruvate dehydrogenase E2 component (dihydrolipoamide acetyltransferase)